MVSHPRESEQEYEHRLHVEAEAEIAALLGEQPHALPRSTVRALASVLSPDWKMMQGWWRSPMTDDWTHESGAKISRWELLEHKNPRRLIAERLHEHLNKTQYPCAPNEIKP